MKLLFDKIKRLIGGILKPHDGQDQRTEHDGELPEHETTTAAFCRETEARPLHVGRRRLKENYTSHWDLDYMPRNEVDELFEDIQRESKSRLKN